MPPCSKNSTNCEITPRYLGNFFQFFQNLKILGKYFSGKEGSSTQDSTAPPLRRISAAMLPFLDYGDDASVYLCAVEISRLLALLGSLGEGEFLFCCQSLGTNEAGWGGNKSVGEGHTRTQHALQHLC